MYFKMNNVVVGVSVAEGYLGRLIWAKECCKDHTRQQISYKRFTGGEEYKCHLWARVEEKGETERQNKRMICDGRDLLKGTWVWWGHLKGYTCWVWWADDDLAAGVERELGEHLVSNNGDFCEKYVSIMWRLARGHTVRAEEESSPLTQP